MTYYGSGDDDGGRYREPVDHECEWRCEVYELRAKLVEALKEQQRYVGRLAATRIRALKEAAEAAAATPICVYAGSNFHGVPASEDAVGTRAAIVERIEALTKEGT